MERTRNSWKCPLFGVICDLKDNTLPIYEDVMKFYEWTRHKMKFENGTKKEPTYKELEAIVINKLCEIWNKASIPTVERKRMKVMLQNYHLKCKNILKSHPNIPENRLEEFRRGGKRLFDIASCKCLDISNCTCPKHKKIPAREHCFLMDQRTVRKMIIGGLDVHTTQQITMSQKRKLLREKSQHKRQKTTPISTEEPDNTSVSSISDLEDEDFIELQCKSTSIVSQSSSAAEVNYALLSTTCDRFGVSNRAGAAIASAVLHASSSQVIDKCKMQRERTKTRKEIVAQQIILNVPALYFDGRKDKTLITAETGGKKYRQIILEEHISLIKEPESNFLGYVTPTAGSAKCIDWQETITEPPVLKSISEESLNLFIEEKGEGEIPLLRLPCHTQAVERAVKTVTEASATLCNKTEREGFIKAQIASRKAMPKFDSKKDFAAI